MTPSRSGSEAGGHTSDSFTFKGREDERGQGFAHPCRHGLHGYGRTFPAYIPANGTPHIPLYVRKSALPASGTSTRRVQRRRDGGAAPDHLGVLGHYDAVIWYTAERSAVQGAAGQPGGTGAETQANTMMLEVRAFLNEGGNLLYTGRHGGWQFADAFDYNPIITPPFCDAVDPTVDDGCLLLSDQHLLRPARCVSVHRGRRSGRGRQAPFDVASGADDPLRRTRRRRPVGDRPGLRAAGRDATNQSFVTTSSILKTDELPAVHEHGSRALGTRRSPAPYEPHAPAISTCTRSGRTSATSAS